MGALPGKYQRLKETLMGKTTPVRAGVPGGGGGVLQLAAVGHAERHRGCAPEGGEGAPGCAQEARAWAAACCVAVWQGLQGERAVAPALLAEPAFAPRPAANAAS